MIKSTHDGCFLLFGYRVHECALVFVSMLEYGADFFFRDGRVHSPNVVEVVITGTVVVAEAGITFDEPCFHIDDLLSCSRNHARAFIKRLDK